MSCISLNVKTNYELMHSLIKVSDLVSYALDNSIKVLGITDSNMFSFMEFYTSCKKNDIKPILGVSFRLDNDFILYAKNYEGYKNLCKLVSIRNIDTLTISVLKEYSNDLICILKSTDNFELYNEIYEILYISYESEEEKLKAQEFTNNIIYMNEILCLNKEDIPYLKYLYMIKDNKTIHDEVNYEFSSNVAKVLNNELEVEKFVSNINLELPEFSYDLPVYSNNSSGLLKSLCKKGLEKRLNNNISKIYNDRLHYELDIIESMGFVNYFLIVYDIVLYAKKNGIYVGPGRGSAVSSLVSFSLGITNIDPIKYNLLFERFLNPSRVSMPDIDIDISDISREELVNYVKEKYGKSNTASIIAFSTLLPKQVIRDVGLVLDISPKRIDDISALIKNNNSFEGLESNPKYKELISYNKDLVKLIDISKKLEGLKKHVTVHAAGVVISSRDLTEKIPLYKNGDTTLTQYDKDYIESMGILKIDLLSLRNLSIIESVLDLIKKNKGISINLNDIPLDDGKTLHLFASAYTTGIFQFESIGIRSLLKQMNISSFNDLVISVAMYRPGPIKMIPLYLNRRNGKESVIYAHESLESVLSETLGIMVYQEQLLEILNIVAGYTYAEADNIRVAIKHKDESVILKEKENFIKRSISNGYNKEVSTEIYNNIIKFANYGFNKSHSVAYATLAYQMGYLKANYSSEFMINLLNSEIGSNTKTKEYIEESRLLGLSFENFNINKSKNNYYIDIDKIVLPLSVIKNVNASISKEITVEQEKSPFIDFIDFVLRCNSRIVNKNVIESLILIGCFDTFGINRKTLIENLESVINYASLCKSLGDDGVITPELKHYDEYESSYLFECEINLLGFYFSNHPVTKYKRDITLNNIDKYYMKNINLTLMIEDFREIKTKKGDKMAFLTLSDEYKSIKGVLFPSAYEKLFTLLKKSSVLSVSARVEKRLNEYQLVINDINKL